jgi:hypothetical protein
VDICITCTACIFLTLDYSREIFAVLKERYLSCIMQVIGLL